MDKAFIKNPVEAYEKLKEENKSLKESLKLISQTLNHTLQSEVVLYKRQIDNSVPDDWEYEEVLALVEEYIEKLKAELEKYKNVINKLAGKTIAITTYDTPIEFCDHKDLTIQQLKAENEALKNNDVFSIRLFKDKADKYEKALKEIKKIVEIENNDIKVLYDRRTHQRMKQILEKISEVIDD